MMVLTTPPARVLIMHGSLAHGNPDSIFTFLGISSSGDFECLIGPSVGSEQYLLWGWFQ